jgi:hypothetical protein
LPRPWGRKQGKIQGIRAIEAFVANLPSNSVAFIMVYS